MADPSTICCAHPSLSRRSVVGVLLRPLTSLLHSTIFIRLPVISHRFIKRVIHIGSRHQSLDWEQNLTKKKSLVSTVHASHRDVVSERRFQVSNSACRRLSVLDLSRIAILIIKRGWQSCLLQNTYSLDLEGGWPLVLENIEANTTCKKSKFRYWSSNLAWIRSIYPL